MTPGKATSAKKTTKSAAAKAETNGDGGPRIAQWRGLEFTLPAKLPATIAWDIAEINEPNAGIGPVLRFIDGLLGPDQVAQLRAKLIEDEVSIDEFEEALVPLLEAIFACYGVTVGESQASAGS